MTLRPYRLDTEYTLEELQSICNESISYADFAKRIGYGENQTHSGKRIVERNNLDCSHFLHQGWNKDNYDLSKFQKGKNIQSRQRLDALIYLRGHKCENCGQTEWLGKPIPLCCHHIDGDNLNNEIENLQLLCPNCHALTDNFCGKNKSGFQKYTEEDFVKALQSSSSINQAMIKMGIHYYSKYYYEKAREVIEKYNIDVPKNTSAKKQNYCVDCGKKVTRNSLRCVECEQKRKQKESKCQYTREELKEKIRSQSFCEIARENNVSDNTIRKWCQKFSLPSKKGDIKSYSDEEWDAI